MNQKTKTAFNDIQDIGVIWVMDAAELINSFK